MQSRPPPSVSNQRLARLTTWLAIWLVRFASLLALIAPREAESLFAGAEKLARVLVVVRALRRAPRRKVIRYASDGAVRNRMTFRIAAGARWRQALRGRTLSERCAKLQRALAGIERWIARLVRRFTRRFTRLYNRRYRTRDELLRAAPACMIACADTS